MKTTPFDPTGIERGGSRLPPSVEPGPGSSAQASDRVGGRQLSLEAVRGVAAALVVTYHLLPQLNVTHPRFLPPVVTQASIRFGAAGVSLFFVLSGFLLFRPFAASLACGDQLPASVPYFARRFARILPAYWVALSTSLFFVGPAQVTQLSDVMSYYLLTQNYRSGDMLHGLGVAWTLVIEVSFYAVLPIIAAIFAMTSRTPATSEGQQLRRIAIVAAIGPLVRVLVYFVVPAPTLKYYAWQPLIAPQNWLPGYLDWFAIGMALAVLQVAQRRRTWSHAWVLKALRTPAICWSAAVALYALDFAFNPGTHGFSTFDLMVRNTLYPLAAGLMIAPLALATHHVRPGPALRTFGAVGAVSYGIYLWHTILIQASIDLIRSGDLPRSAMLQGVVVVVATLCVAVASYFGVERPFIRMSHRIGRGPRDRH